MSESFEEMFSATNSSGGNLSVEQISSILQRREESLLKWNLLPVNNCASAHNAFEELVDSAEKLKKNHVHRRPRKFYSMSMAEICSTMLGENRIK